MESYVQKILVPTLLRGNAYRCDEHFMTSSSGEVTKKQEIKIYDENQ